MAGKQKAKKGAGNELAPSESAILLRLAKGASSRAELMAGLKGEGYDPKALSKALSDLTKGGLVREGSGKTSLRRDLSSFKQVLGICSADGKAADLLATSYSKAILSDDLFPVLTKEFVHSAILSTLMLLTMPPVDRAKNSSLLLLHKTINSDPDSLAAMQGIAGSLEAIGFPEALKKGLADLRTKQERESETHSKLDKLTEDYLSRFLGGKTPLPSALDGCQALLFPEKERAEILEIIRSSPFALTFLLANEEKSQGTVISIATPLLLPALENMFTLYALLKLFSSAEGEAYIEEKKKRADKEFKELVERRKGGMQRPSHLLLALRSCRKAEMA